MNFRQLVRAILCEWKEEVCRKYGYFQTLLTLQSPKRAASFGQQNGVILTMKKYFTDIHIAKILFSTYYFAILLPFA
jgi:hypothetical protein